MQDKVTAFVAGCIMLACGSTALASARAAAPDQTSPRPFPGRPHTADHFYPQTAQFCRERGAVRLNLTIDERGHVIASRITDTSGHRDLDQAAQKAVRTWEYLPAILRGKPVKARWLVQVVFRMDEPISIADRAISWGCGLAELLTGR